MRQTTSSRQPAGPAAAARPDRYKWVALTNTTAGVMLATIDMSIIMISMPDIFRGIHLDPLASSNSFFLLWMLLGYSATGSVLLVTLGRLGDQFGRVKMYNLGFVIYTTASLILAVDPLDGAAGAWWLLGFRIMQAVGGAFLVANSAAILTDAFPASQRGLALGINNLAAMSGSFIGLVIGGLLGPVDWRLIFFISVPLGLFGTVWAYRNLQERSVPVRAPIDWQGNVTFAGGLFLIMVAITYGIQPYGTHPMGWMSPRVLACAACGIALLALFLIIETRTEHPMFRLALFRIRAFTFGSLSTFLASLARGGLQFMLIIWLQGIWLPQHGVSFQRTPIWAGICMLPTTFGMLVAGPISGWLSDRFDKRLFATGGMIGAACAFGLLLLLPVDFSYPFFALALLLSGVSMGTFNSPNRSAVMNSLPARNRGAGSGMNSTFMQSGQVFSQGVFFTLMILGLSAALPAAIGPGLQSHGVPAAIAQHIAHLPPVSILFATFLGYNPLQQLLGRHVLASLPPAAAHLLTGHEYFPRLISAPFRSGLTEVFTFSIIICLVAAAASWSRGARYVADDAGAAPGASRALTPSVPVAAAARADRAPADDDGAPAQGTASTFTGSTRSPA